MGRDGAPTGALGEVDGGGYRVLMMWGKVSCYRGGAGKGAEWGIGGCRGMQGGAACG